MIVASVAGAVLASGGLALGANDDPVDLAPQVTTTDAVDVTTPTLPRVGVLGSSVIIPTSVAVEDELVVVQFDVNDIAPTPQGIHIDNARPGFRQTQNFDIAVAAPELWTLIASDGTEYPGTTSSVRARSARFPVPSDFDGETIASIRIDQFRQRAPIDYRLVFDTSDTEEFNLDPFTTIGLDSILSQATSTTYRFAVHDSFDGFATSGNFLLDAVVISGDGPGWISGGPWQGGMQLTHSSGDPLPQVDLVVQTTNWLELPADVMISIASLVETP